MAETRETDRNDYSTPIPGQQWHHNLESFDRPDYNVWNNSCSAPPPGVRTTVAARALRPGWHIWIRGSAVVIRAKIAA